MKIHLESTTQRYRYPGTRHRSKHGSTMCLESVILDLYLNRRKVVQRPRNGTAKITFLHCGKEIIVFSFFRNQRNRPRIKS